MRMRPTSFEHRLLEAITTAQSRLVKGDRQQAVFDGLLAALLDLTDSAYGFIGEVLHDGETPYLKTHAITDIAWDDETRAFYAAHAPQGMEFRNLRTLFGAVMTTGERVISNAPTSDPRRGGLPAGHPPLDAFMGLPLHAAGELVGMVGVANREGGYDEGLAELLDPFLLTCANLIFAARAEAARQRAENVLREQERTTRGVLDGLAEAVVTIDASGRILSANEAVRRLFGYAPDELLGLDVAVLVGEPHRSMHSAYLERYLREGNPRVLGIGREVEGRHRDGTPVAVFLSLSEAEVNGRRLFTGTLRDLSEVRDAEARAARLASALAQSRHGELLGNSPPMRRLLQEVSDVATVSWPVVIEGETGSGKELVARSIHAASGRRDEPLVAVNCASLSDTLLESRLFGHRRGAFTGAVRDQPGLFEAAHGGTLFLDEIGDISPSLQRALLRALQEGEVVRVGEAHARRVDVRMIVATNRDLEEEVRAGRFRSDLFYRLRVGRIRVPPLRARREDVPLLARGFLARARQTSGKPVADLTDEALAALKRHAWPGNVRELVNAIQFAVIHCSGTLVDVHDLPPELRHGARRGAVRRESTLAPAVGASGIEAERERILRAIARAGGVRSEAAKLLGVSRATFYRRLQQLGIDPR